MVAPDDLTERQKKKVTQLAPRIFEHCQWLVSAVDTFEKLESAEKELVCYWPGHEELKGLIEEVKKA